MLLVKKNLIDDLKYWKTFYLAGRFQKPMLNVKYNDELYAAIEHNRRNAVILALFLLGEGKHTVSELYSKICSLSYLGDTIMGIAESPNKVNNIVNGGFNVFEEMYYHFGLFEKEVYNDQIYYDIDLINSSISDLPFSIPEPSDKILYTKEELIEYKNLILKELMIKNRDASIGQTIKGLLTAGPIKSAYYIRKKISKRVGSK